MPRTMDEQKEILILQAASERFERFGYKKTTVEKRWICTHSPSSIPTQ